MLTTLRGWGRRLGAGLLISVLLTVSAGCGLVVDNETRMERAAVAFEGGDYRAAVIDLRNVLQEEPDNRAARILLGRAALRANDPETAVKELRRAIELGASLETVALDLGEAMLDLRRFDAVLDEIVPDLASNEVDRLAILRLRADATTGLRLPESARDIYFEVLALDPDDVRAQLGVASTFLAQERYEEARAAVNDALAMDPGHVPAWLASGSLHLASGDAEAATNDFVEARELADGKPDEVSALIGLVEARLASEDLPAARQAVRDLQELAPENLMTRYLAGRVAFLDEDLETAQSQLQQVLGAAPEYRPAQLLMGAVHLQRGNLGQAEMHLTSVVAAEPDNADARRLLAETRLRQNRAAEATEILRPLLETDAADPATVGLAVRASMAAGEYDSAIGFIRENVEANPGNVGLKLDLVGTYLAAGRVEEARRLLDSLPEEAGEAEYRRDMLEVLTPLRRGDRASALSVAETMAEEWPKDARIRNLLGGIAMAAGRTDIAREAFAEARALAPAELTAYVNTARLELTEGDLTAARNTYRAALEQVPESVPVMTALAQLEARMENRDAAVEWLQKARAAGADSLVPRLLLARVHLVEGDFEAARAMAREAVEIADGNAEAYSLLGQAQRALQDAGGAAESFDRAVEIDPDNYDYRINEARALMAAGDPDAAEQALAGTGAAELDYLPAAVILAAVKAQQGNEAEAMDIARGLQARYPEDGVPYALEGELLADQKQFEAAAAAYDQALSLRGDDRNLVVRAFRVRTLGDLPQPEKPLLEFLAREPDDAGIRILLAQRFQTAGASSEAIREYEEALSLAPDNAVALNNLAWEYFQVDDPRAEETARKAYALAPGNGSVADTLGWIQVNTGRLEEGIALLREAVELSDGRPQVRYHLAAALAKTGATDEARRILSELVAGDAEFSSRDEAEELLATL